MKGTLVHRLRNYFLAGFIAILPLWATILILILVFRGTASLAKPLVKNIPALAQSPFILDLVSAVVTIFLVMGLGVLLTNVLGRRLFLFIEGSVQKIPLLSWIYSAIRKLTALFYQEEGKSRFDRVVMIEYPRKGIYVIGYLTTNAVSVFNRKSGRELVNVFLPTTPNPTSGFLLMVPKEDITPLDISTEDSVKLIVSAGISAPEEN